MIKTLFLRKYLSLFTIFFTYSLFGFDFSDVEKIANNLAGLGVKLADPKGVIKKITDLNDRVKELLIFKNCKKAKEAQNKPNYDFSVSHPQAPGIKVYCGNYNVPISAITSILELIKDDLIGTKDSKGVLFVILDVLRIAGLKDVAKVQDAVNTVNSVIASLDSLLLGLKETMKVEEKKA